MLRLGEEAGWVDIAEEHSDQFGLLHLPVEIGSIHFEQEFRGIAQAVFIAVDVESDSEARQVYQERTSVRIVAGERYPRRAQPAGRRSEGDRKRRALTRGKRTGPRSGNLKVVRMGSDLGQGNRG